MIISIASTKGGVAKTTTAVHIAAYLNDVKPDEPTLLIDSDPNRSALSWSKLGNLPFKVVDERQAARFVPQFQHVIIDTEAGPSLEDFETLIEGSDLLVIPATPDAMSLRSLPIDVLSEIPAEKYRILLTIIPPKPNRDADEARVSLRAAGLPVLEAGVRRYAAYQKSALQGCPVYAVVGDKNARIAWSDYRKVCEELGL